MGRNDIKRQIIEEPEEINDNIIHIDPENKSAQELIIEAERIKKNIEILNNVLLNNKKLKYQYELYKNKQLIFPQTQSLNVSQTNTPLSNKKMYDASEDFIKLLHEYGIIANDYKQLVDNAILTRLVSPQEMQSIETSAQKTPDAKFFPFYQTFYASEAEAPKSALAHAANMHSFEKSVLENNYQGRKDFYKKWYTVTGILSLGVVGLPFFIGGIVAHTLDKIITSLRDVKIEHTWKKENKKYQTELNQAEASTQNLINPDRTARFKQGFFELSKVSHKEPILDMSKPVQHKVRGP